MIGLDGDGPPFGWRQDLLAAQENLADGSAREAEKEDSLSVLERRRLALGLQQGDRGLAGAGPAEDQKVSALCDDRLAFFAQLQLH